MSERLSAEELEHARKGHYPPNWNPHYTVWLATLDAERARADAAEKALTDVGFRQSVKIHTLASQLAAALDALRLQACSCEGPGCCPPHILLSNLSAAALARDTRLRVEGAEWALSEAHDAICANDGDCYCVRQIGALNAERIVDGGGA